MQQISDWHNSNMKILSSSSLCSYLVCSSARQMESLFVLLWLTGCVLMRWVFSVLLLSKGMIWSHALYDLSLDMPRRSNYFFGNYFFSLENTLFFFLLSALAQQSSKIFFPFCIPPRFVAT
jgi:hypothetical protein